MDTRERDAATSTGSCQSGDWAGTWRGWAIWGSAVVLLLLGGQLPDGRTWLLFSGFLLAGVGCVANAVRCGRRHCYFTGPVCLLAAMYVGLTGLHVVPTEGNIFWGVLVVVGAVGCLSEHVLGRYVRRA